MGFTFSKRRIIYILFVFALLLLISNLILDKIVPEEKQSEKYNSGNNLKVSERFNALLEGYGINKDWIVNRKKANVQNAYRIFIPADLAIPVIIAEIYSEFRQNNLQIESIEKKTGGATVVRIFSGDKLLLESEFTYNKKLRRKKGTVGIIVKDFVFEDREDSLFIKSAEPFCLLLLPSKDNIGITGYIISGRKEYSVLLNDNIEALEYRLRDDFSNQRILNSLKAIIGSYPDAAFFIIDDGSGLFNSNAYNIIQAELVERGIPIKLLSSFINVDLEEDEGFIKSFKDEINNLGKEDKKIFILNESKYLMIQPEIETYRKKGLRFDNVSRLLK